MPDLVIKNPVLGGIADTKYLGVADSVARAVGLDLHGEPGIIRANQRTTKESGIGLIDGFVKARVNCSNGEVYFFSGDSGKVWRRSAAGAYSLAYTTVAGAGASACLGAREYNGYVYWATQSRLHRISTANALSESTWTTLSLNWGTFTNGDLLFHPMVENNLVLYIGDANLLAQVDDATFSASALDIPTPIGTAKRIAALGKYFTDVLLGTFMASTVTDTQIFRWNTWSDSFSIEDSVPEVGISAFLNTDNATFVAAGKKGFIYQYDGSQLAQSRRIPGDWTKDNSATVNPDAVENKNGMALFGVSDVSGSPCDCGVYSIGRYSPAFPTIMNLEHPISTGRVALAEIGTLTLYGSKLLISWRQSATVSVTIASPGVVTYASHGLSNGDAIVFSTTGALPTGIVAGTVYYVGDKTADTFNLYDTSAHGIAGGATGRVNTSGSQSGEHTALTYGVDAVDNTAKQGALIVDGESVAGPFFDSRVIDVERETQKDFTVRVPYRSIPSGTSVQVWHSVNGGAWTQDEVTLDTDNLLVTVALRVPNANTVEFRVVLVTSGDDTPEVESAIISY